MDDSLIWKTNRRLIELRGRTLIMGILNVTPDSFSDGGSYQTKDQALERALTMVEEGADIIDIGGESTRPGSVGVGLECELERVLPVIEALAGKIEVPISIDTTKAEVARRAVAAGAEIINDISALRFDDQMVHVVRQTGAAVILMHMRGTPQNMQKGPLIYEDLLGEIGSFLRERMIFAESLGVEKVRIAIDPGLGFGKTRQDNLKLIKNLSYFSSLNRPVLSGVSRKSFTSIHPGDAPAQRVFTTAAAVTASILAGCHIVRVHDVRAMKEVACLADEIARS